MTERQTSRVNVPHTSSRTWSLPKLSVSYYQCRSRLWGWHVTGLCVSLEGHLPSPGIGKLAVLWSVGRQTSSDSSRDMSSQRLTTPHAYHLFLFTPLNSLTYLLTTGLTWHWQYFLPDKSWIFPVHREAESPQNQFRKCLLPLYSNSQLYGATPVY